MLNPSRGRCIYQALPKFLLGRRLFFIEGLARSFSLYKRNNILGSSYWVVRIRVDVHSPAFLERLLHSLGLTKPSALTTSTPFDSRSNALEDSALRVVPLTANPLALFCRTETMTLPSWDPVAP